MTPPGRPVECRSCRAPIFWATTAKSGAPMPLDFEDTFEGNVRLERTSVRNGLYETRAVVLGPIELELARAEGETLYMPHHATCPQGAEWKR